MERTNYGDAVIHVVDSFGDLVHKVIVYEDGSKPTMLVPILAMDCPNPEWKHYYWVSKHHF